MPLSSARPKRGIDSERRVWKMGAFVAALYGVILVMWAVVFELGGFALMYVLYQAIQRDDVKVNEATEDSVPPENRSGDGSQKDNSSSENRGEATLGMGTSA
jgi:hypothetical protein